jgi:peroxiredoxin
VTGDHVIGVGDLLPDVTFVDHRGAPFRFSDHRGRPLVLVLHRHLA